MKPLIDADILRYELGFACETGWKAITEDPEAIPPWDYVEQNLHQRIDNICAVVGATEKPVLYLTEGKTFRDDIATQRPYKGARKPNKPWHFKNLSVYMKDVLGAIVVSGIEADDAMAIEHVANPDTIICSRDKDLRQVPGWFYSWELGNQPAFGPVEIDKNGWIEMQGGKLKGTGLSFFYAQCIMGDNVDSIPGLEGYGPVKAYNILKDKTPEEMLQAVKEEYAKFYNEDVNPIGILDKWEIALLEQGQLLWMVRRYNSDGTPQLWEFDLTE